MKMRTWKRKTEKKERGKLERQKHAERGKGWVKKRGGKSNRTKS